MTDKTVLTESQIDDAAGEVYVTGTLATLQELQFARAIEQAVLQSAEVQRLREDAGRWQTFRRAMSTEDADILDRIETHIENAIDNADGTPTEDQIDDAIDAAIGRQL